MPRPRKISSKPPNSLMATTRRRRSVSPKRKSPAETSPAPPSNSKRWPPHSQGTPTFRPSSRSPTTDSARRLKPRLRAPGRKRFASGNEPLAALLFHDLFDLLQMVLIVPGVQLHHVRHRFFASLRVHAE